MTWLNVVAIIGVLMAVFAMGATVGAIFVQRAYRELIEQLEEGRYDL